jgi:hypothetical protein
MSNDSAVSFTLRWAAVYAVTECIAVVAASLVAATTWPLVLLCAVIEGTLLGFGQGWLLYGKRVSPVLRWVPATIAGVLAGRFIEYGADISPAARTILTMPLEVQILAGLVLGAAVGAASGSFQALLLRGRVAHPLQWIAVSSVAWGVSLPALLLVGAAVEGLSAVTLWQGTLAVLGLFLAIGAVAGAIEGTGLSVMFRAAERV